MLHEASTILKAIEKAWVESGKPRAFTINVLEMGEKNFLGFAKHPAIVSITYDPVSATEGKIDEKKQQVKREFAPRPQRPLPDRGIKKDYRDSRDVREPRKVDDRRIEERRRVEQPETFWAPELVNDIRTWFKELVDLMDIQITYEYNVDKRMLFVTFQKNIMSTPDEDRQLFVGLSHLLIQFLKKKYKRKLQGYHLVIKTKDYAANN